MWYGGSTVVKTSDNALDIACAATVKYDTEFTGVCMFKIDADTGEIIASLDKVLFICDSDEHIHDVKSRTGGDCPDFISSEEANKIANENNL